MSIPRPGIFIFSGSRDSVPKIKQIVQFCTKSYKSRAPVLESGLRLSEARLSRTLFLSSRAPVRESWVGLAEAAATPYTFDLKSCACAGRLGRTFGSLGQVVHFFFQVVRLCAKLGSDLRRLGLSRTHFLLSRAPTCENAFL